MKVLLFGAQGQLGWELQRSCPAGVSLTALSRKQADLSQVDSLATIISAQKPQLIINAAAYTAVDKAEHERDLAWQINGVAAGRISDAAAAINARLIHISTDFVFSGVQGAPLQPDSLTTATGAYGASKREGEVRVQHASPHQALILRTAWVYSAHGQNFVKTMLRLMSTRESLGVVADQIGSPTWAAGLATAIWRATELPELAGIHHWTDAGVASWYDFACAIAEEALTLGLLNKSVSIQPITTADYPTPAKRPATAVLDKTATWKALGLAPAHWRAQLRNMLIELKEGST